MERQAAPGGLDARPAPIADPRPPAVDGAAVEAIEAAEAIEAIDDWKLADHLAPVDLLLRELSKIEPPGECPDCLCRRTLDRCRTSIIGG
jgi:hypothetical protein